MRREKEKEKEKEEREGKRRIRFIILDSDPQCVCSVRRQGVQRQARKENRMDGGHSQKV